MNKKILLITVVLFLISMTAVSAEDINQTNDTLEITDSDVVSAGETKSFMDLSTDIDNSPEDRIDITSDYKYNAKTDKDLQKGKPLVISETGSYTINGNNHVIDAGNKAAVFRFTNGTVIINNLKIINSNTSAIYLNNCELRTNNVTFENNHDYYEEGGAIYAHQSNYFSTNDKFINNYAKKGASINAFRSIVEIDHSTFINNREIGWSLIYAYKSLTTVKNTVFENITSQYATAIYSEDDKLTVLNSKFINLFAKNTAGAIGLKTTKSVNIENCSFIHTESCKNGGAIYADLNGDNVTTEYSVTVKNSLFKNCSSEFGGAYLQLGGQINIIDTELLNNVAEYSGGAIYLSNTSALIGNSAINNNKAKYFYGGAVFIDDSEGKVTSCDIKNNTAGTTGSGIYLYDTKYEIKNTLFEKNSNAVIVSYFDKKGSFLTNNELNGGKTLLNQVEYTSVVDYKGKKIILKPVKVKETAKSSKFDLRDYNLAGIVKDQGSMGSCWAFAATGALESAFLKATGIQLDLSENNIQNSATQYGVYGTTIIHESGYSTSGMGLFLAWLGTLSFTDDVYDELGKISLTAFDSDSYHVQDSIIIPKRVNALDNEKLKDALTKYGGLTVHIYGAISNNDYYNPDTHAQYYDGTDPGNHFVTLVGWDDNYSKNNFKITPKGNGAWICKNSWGNTWGEDGYFYVSYYDTSFAMYTTSVGYIINNTESYDRAYQYDIGMLSGYYQEFDKKDMRFVNTYTAIDNELISAVGTYFENANEKYTITIYVDGKSVYSQSGLSDHGGFSTIKLNKKIAVNTGHEFSVEIKANKLPLMEDTRIHFEKGKITMYHPDNSSEDGGQLGKTACIKAYTFTNPNPDKVKSQYYAKNTKVKVKSKATGKKISIAKNKKTLGSATVKDGEAEFDLELEPGVYSIITINDEEDEYEDIVELFEVINTIDVVDSITIGYHTQTSLNAIFVDETGIELFDQNITYQLDGKNYNETIKNNRGILSIDLSKLTVGTHTLVLENPETLEQTTTIIKVVSRFGATSNVNMYYADGSSFKVLVRGDDGKPVGANQIVTIKLNKVTHKVKTNSKGYVTFKIPNTVKPGNYKLTATYAGQTIKKTVKVKQNLKLAKATVKKSAKKLVIKATLKKGKTPIKSKKVTFKFNGKTYKAKTNSKGIAKITIKKSVLKKLKVGKKVKYQVTYLKNTVKKSVKVKK